MNAPSFAETKKEKINVISWLSEQFPGAFFERARDIKPLKIGILDDIFDFYERLDNPLYSKKQLREAINYYSGSPNYLNNQQTGAARIDLFGNEIDLVDEAQAQYARQRYKTRYGQALRKTNK